MKEKTYTKQRNCKASFVEKKNIEKPETTENLDPKAVLLDSLLRFYAELDDFQKVAEKYFDNIDKKGKKRVQERQEQDRYYHSPNRIGYTGTNSQYATVVREIIVI